MVVKSKICNSFVRIIRVKKNKNGAVALNSQKENDSIQKKVLGHFCFRGIIKLQEILKKAG